MGCPSAIEPPFTFSLAASKAELAVAGEDLGGEGLVQLDEVVVARLAAEALHQRAGRRDGTEAHDLRIDPGRRVRLERRERREAEVAGRARAHDEQGGGAVRDARRRCPP